MVASDLDPRRQVLWKLQDFSHGRGLEVGPLHDPVVRRGEADVRYVDVQDQEGLRRYYADHPGIGLESIPEIDYTLIQPDGRTVSLVEACRDGAPFDWVVASHVVEHIPDLIGWLAELAELVADGGSAVLVVPDRRFSFDVFRPPTTVGQMLEAHRDKAVRPGLRAVYDHYSSVVEYDVSDLWAGVLPTYADRRHIPSDIRDFVSKSLAGDYVDSHVWLFTPDSFVDQMYELRTTGQSSWYVDAMDPTAPNENEFRVRLRRIPRSRDPLDEPADEVTIGGSRPEWLVEQTAGRTHRVAELERLNAALEASVQRLRRRVDRLAARSEQQQARLRTRSEQLERRDRKIAGLRAALRSRSEELETIRSSLRWRLSSVIATPPAALRKLVQKRETEGLSRTDDADGTPTT